VPGARRRGTSHERPKRSQLRTDSDRTDRGPRQRHPAGDRLLPRHAGDAIPLPGPAWSLLLRLRGRPADARCSRQGPGRAQELGHLLRGPGPPGGFRNAVGPRRRLRGAAAPDREALRPRTMDGLLPRSGREPPRAHERGPLGEPAGASGLAGSQASSAARCSSKMRRTAASPMSSMRARASRPKGRPSAEPWTSTNSPSPVITRFRSTSAWLSSS